ncbi:MAG: aminotransferase class IV [Planctomycetes bacterium]|nr:aminotransferase class IV [Planctomycetota bacterium]
MKPTMHVWINGKLIQQDSANISIFDAGFQHGIGLFETMTARHGKVFRAHAHMNRLAESAKLLLLSDRLRIEPLVEAVNHVVQENNMESARVRLTLTGGNLNQLQNKGEKRIDPTIIVVAQPPTEYPQEFFDKGVTVMIADGRENPFDPMAGHKTLNYWQRIHALQLATTKQASEALWFSVSNHISSGSVSNIFLVKDNELFTPIARGEEVEGSIPSSTLPGITRSAIIEIAEQMEIKVNKKMLDINNLLSASEVFLTNSSWGVLPVVGMEREKIAGGEVGAISKQMRDALQELIEKETQ